MLEEAEAIVEMTKSDGLADANKISTQLSPCILRALPMADIYLSEISKVTRDMINQLAADEDVVMLQAIFNTYFSDFDAGDPVDVEPSTLADVFDQDIMDSCDLGVEIESQLSVKDIERNLGFLQGIPALFNCWRHHSGATVWDNKDLFKDAEKNLQLKPLRLKRHQLDAIHAILRMMFPHNASPNQGVLLADEVGLGKSAVIMGLIAVLAQILAGGHPPLVGESHLIHVVTLLMQDQANPSFMERPT